MKVHLEKPNWIYPPVQQKQSNLNVGLEALLPPEFSPSFKSFTDVNSELRTFFIRFLLLFNLFIRTSSLWSCVGHFSNFPLMLLSPSHTHTPFMCTRTNPPDPPSNTSCQWLAGTLFVRFRGPGETRWDMIVFVAVCGACGVYRDRVFLQCV